MIKLVSIFVAILLGLSSGRLIEPRDLVEQAREQLTQLKSIVVGEIMVAHDGLDDLITEFRTNQLNVASDADITIQQQARAIDSNLQTIVNLATSAGFDVTECTNVRQEVLKRLPESYKEKIGLCIRGVDDEGVRTIRSAKYIVDINMNKVHDIENQFDRCREDFLCISPLITEIELNKVRMPQNIKAEVLAAETVFNLLKLSVKTCADSNIAEYTIESYSILSDIEECVGEIIG